MATTYLRQLLYYDYGLLDYVEYRERKRRQKTVDELSDKVNKRQTMRLIK